MIRKKTKQELNTQRRIGQYCKEWRMEKGITQTQIAELNEVTTSTICDFEKGLSDNYIYLLTYILQGLPVFPLIEIWGDNYGRKK